MKRRVEFTANNPKAGFRARELRQLLEGVQDDAVIRVTATVGLSQVPKKISIEEEV